MTDAGPLATGALALLMAATAFGQPFVEEQRSHERVALASAEKDTVWAERCRLAGLPYPPSGILLRALKGEKTLEIWSMAARTDSFRLLQTYPICASSGVPGPKRREGDFQVPEGVYEINHFNYESDYFLSLGVNYPNASDRILSDKEHPGGDIYIHGSCVTIGCIPIEDEAIKEVYWLAVRARGNGQERIPVLIFPGRMDAAGLEALREAYAGDTARLEFWDNLRWVYAAFERGHRPPEVTVGKRGEYVVVTR